MKMKCDKPKQLNKLGKKIDKAHSYDEWVIYNNEADDIAFEMANCNKCCYKVCKQLHDDLYR